MQLTSLFLVVGMSPPWFREGTFPVGHLFPAFRGSERGRCVLLAPAVTLIQNNQYVTSAYLGAPCPEPHRSCVTLPVVLVPRMLYTPFLLLLCPT